MSRAEVLLQVSCSSQSRHLHFRHLTELSGFAASTSGETPDPRPVSTSPRSNPRGEQRFDSRIHDGIAYSDSMDPASPPLVLVVQLLPGASHRESRWPRKEARRQSSESLCQPATESSALRAYHTGTH